LKDSFGNVDWNVVRAFSRVYARAVSGTPTAMNFDADNLIFRLEWTIDHSIEQPTEIFVPMLHYSTGFNVQLTDGLSWTFSEMESVLYVVVSSSNDRLSLATAFVMVTPKNTPAIDSSLL
jgi:hypothetical protein